MPQMCSLCMNHLFASQLTRSRQFYFLYSSQFRLPIYHKARKTPGEKKNHLALRSLGMKLCTSL